MSHYPELATLIQNPNKNRLLEVRRSPVSMLSMIGVFLASIIGAYLLATLLESGPFVELKALFSPRIFVLLPLILLLELLRRLHNDLYIFSQHRLTHLHGRFSFSYTVPVIKYVDIRAINVIQDFSGRIFDYGDVTVGTAAHEGYEIRINGVRAPEKLALLIDQLRSYSLKLESSELSQTTNVSTNE